MLAVVSSHSQAPSQLGARGSQNSRNMAATGCYNGGMKGGEMQEFKITRVAVLNDGSKRRKIVAKGVGWKDHQKAVGLIGMAYYFPRPNTGERSVEYVTTGL